MNLANGETLFDRMETTYDDLRKSNDPVGNVVNYYKSQMKDGERLWWAASHGEESVLDVDEMTIRLASTLTAGARKSITAEGIALFPEVLGSGKQKYARFVLWVATEHMVVSPSTRDFFSAGGRADIKTSIATYSNLPKIAANIQKLKEKICSSIEMADETTLCQTWRVDGIETNRVEHWITLAAKNLYDFGANHSDKKIRAAHPNPYDVFYYEEVLKAIFKE